MTNFYVPNNVSSMKYALKSVPGLADVGVPHGVEDGPRTTPRCVGRVWKKFQMTNFIMPNNSCSMKYALKSVPGLAVVEVQWTDVLFYLDFKNGMNPYLLCAMNLIAHHCKG